MRALTDWQPEAKDIRFEGECDACHEDGLYSYTLPEYPEITHQGGIDYEYCGYWCEWCNFSNAGMRALEPGGF